MNADASFSDAELVARIAATSDLPSGTARRVVEDVLAHHAESLEDYVIRRHRELAGEGWKNEAIYRHLCAEVEGRLFKAPAVSVRQVRRMIYG